MHAKFCEPLLSEGKKLRMLLHGIPCHLPWMGTMPYGFVHAGSQAVITQNVLPGYMLDFY